MTEERFYRLAVWLPIALPLVTGPIGLAVSKVFGADRVAAILMSPVVPLLYGGIPYAIAAGILLFVFRGRPADFYRRLSFVAPLVFALVLAVIACASSIVLRRGDSWMDLLVQAGALAGLAIAFGYAYVAIVHALRLVLRRRGVIRASG